MRVALVPRVRLTTASPGLRVRGGKDHDRF